MVTFNFQISINIYIYIYIFIYHSYSAILNGRKCTKFYFLLCLKQLCNYYDAMFLYVYNKNGGFICIFDTVYLVSMFIIKNHYLIKNKIHKYEFYLHQIILPMLLQTFYFLSMHNSIFYILNFGLSWSYGSCFYNYLCNQCLSITKGVGMIRVDFGPISETVYIDIILNTIIER